jgi:glycosyltransferase involved in cell wall biosynthesis
MDDCSTDGTMDIIKTYPFQCIHNTVKRPYPINNFIFAINNFATKREDIITFLSGDDYLYCEDVLEHLNGVYQNPDIWLTYGNFIPSSGKYEPICKPITDTKNYRRSHTWYASHLVTCKKKLWEKIDDKDLRLYGKEYPNNSFDAAFLYPMIEMCGNKHLQFVEKILYVYNDQNPVGAAHFAEDKHACMRERKYFVNKPSYPELVEL